MNTLLQDFDFDRTMAEFKDFGFTRAYARWSTEPPQLANGKTAPSPKEFMENGGTAYLILRSDSSAQRLGYVAGQPAGSGKGVGIERVCRLLDIPRENTYAIGDSVNDLDMFRYAAHGICMGNGTAVAKEAAEYITDDLHADGFLHAMEHYGLI